MKNKTVLKILILLAFVIFYVTLICLMDKFLIARIIFIIVISVAAGLQIGEWVNKISDWLADKLGWED